MMDARARAIDHPDIATVSVCNRVHDPVPDAGRGPAPEPVVPRGAGAIPFG